MQKLHAADRRRRTLVIRDRALEVIARRGRWHGNFELRGVTMLLGSFEKGGWFFELTKPRDDRTEAPSPLEVRYRGETVFRSVSEGPRMRVPIYVPGRWEDILLARADQSEESA